MICKEIFSSEPIIADSKDKIIGDVIIISHLPQDYTAKVDPLGQVPVLKPLKHFLLITIL